MIVNVFLTLRVTHPDGPLVRRIHDLWRDITGGIARRVAEAMILKNGGGIGDVDDIRLAGLVATRIKDCPTWIAVSSGGMGIVTVSEKSAAEPLPQLSGIGYDPPGNPWIIPMEVGQHFVVMTEHTRAKLTGSRALVALGQLKRVERAVSTMLSQSVIGAGTGTDQAILVIDVLTPEDKAALASSPILEREAEPENDLPASQLSDSWGLEALGTNHSMRPRAPHCSHMIPPMFDDFRFVFHLGSGGFSDVYLYGEQLPKWLVMIKILSCTALGEGGFSQSRGEIDLMARLFGHPSVVEIHNADVAESGQPYVIMQHYPTPPLAERLANGSLPIEDMLKMGAQVTSAVHTAHVVGIMRHGLRPTNALYSQFGRPLLGDSEIATLAGATNQDVIGVSLPWTTPRVFLNQQADARAGAYSLVTTVYTVLSGHAPFAIDGALTRCEYITHMFATQLTPLGLGEKQSQETDTPDNAGAFERLGRVFMAVMEREVGKCTTTVAEFGRRLRGIQATLGYQPTDLEAPGQRIRSLRTMSPKVHDIFLIRAKIGAFFASTCLCGYGWRRAGGILLYLPRRGGLGWLLVADLVTPVASTCALSTGEKQ